MTAPGPAGTGLVGRTTAIDALRATLAAASTGGARLALVTGEPGIGKTTLLTHVVGSVSGSGTAVAWGTCWDAARAPALWPWLQLARSLLRDDIAIRSLDELGPARGELRRLVPELPGSGVPPADAGDEQARFLLFDAVTRWIEVIARHRPLVLVLDDLQWADLSSVHLLAALCRPYRAVPLTVLVAYRPDEVPDAAGAVLTDLASAGEHLHLAGLTPSEVTALVSAWAGQQAAQRWGAEVSRRSGGNPFFVRELTTLLLSDPATTRVPAAVRDVIGRRLGRLEHHDRQVLRVAAVAGNALMPDVLAAAGGFPAAAVAAAVEAAAELAVLASDGEQYRFAHDLYRETVYDSLDPARRCELHLAVAEALEQRHRRGAQVQAAALARHFTAAVALDGPQRALRWAFAAAAADRSRLAFTEEAAHLRRARAATEAAGASLDAATLIDLLLAEAEAHTRAGHAEQARQLLHDAWDRTVDLGDPSRMVRAALALAALGARFAMPRDDVVAVLEQARESAAGDARLAAIATAQLARELHHSVPTQRARADPLSQQALELASTADDPTTLASCLLARHDVLWSPGNAGERLDLAREIVLLGERTADPERRVEGLLLAANALLEGGSPAFRVELAEYLRAAGRLRQPRHDYMVLTRRAALALLDGTIDAGEELVEQAAALGRKIAEPDTGNVRMSQRLEVARIRADPQLLIRTAEEAVGWWVGVPLHAHAVAAGLYARAGDLDAARRSLRVVRELGDWRGDRSYLWTVFAGGLAVAAARLRDEQWCTELLTELGPLAGSCGVNGAMVCFAGSHAHWAAIVADALGRVAEAAEHLDRATKVYERIGAPAWLAELSAELAGPALPAEPARPAATATALLRRDGELWQIRYRGRSAHLRAAKGLSDLSVLLARPGVDVPASELAGARTADSIRPAPVLDTAARNAYQRRLADIDAILGRASDVSRSSDDDRLRTEQAALRNELRQATGLSGRNRRLGPEITDRSRKMVTARIRDAIRRIADVLPELGTHLDRSVITGNYCRYQPSEPLTWSLQADE